MSDTLIQIESKEDISFLRNELSSYAETNFELSEQEHSAFSSLLDQVMQVVCDNIQINGMTFEQATKQTQEFEQVNEELLQAVAKLQEENAELLLKVSKKRKQIPILVQSKVKENLKSRGEQLQAFINEIKPSSETELFEINASLVNENTFKSTATLLNSLNEEIPQVVAKLERAQAVLAEEGSKRVVQVQESSTPKRSSRSFNAIKALSSGKKNPFRK